jgi:hypothetical protein
MRLGKKPLEWLKPLVRGKAPRPRYSHTMNYFEEGNFLIVHGGRNDLTSDSFALNDTHIFDLQKLEWQEITLLSETDSPGFSVFNRCGHSAIVYCKYFFYFLFLASKLIIFGGMNNLNYIGSSIFIINMDLNYKFIKENEENKLNEILRLAGGKGSAIKKGMTSKNLILPQIK